jgi:hypothetical protein
LAPGTRRGAKSDLICFRREVYMPSVPDSRSRLNLEIRLLLQGRSLMSRWETLRYYAKMTLLAFCLRPLPHYQPSPRHEIVS